MRCNVNSAGSRNRWYRVLHKLHYFKKVHQIVWRQKKTHISSNIACEPVRPQVQKWHHITINWSPFWELCIFGYPCLAGKPLLCHHCHPSPSQRFTHPPRSPSAPPPCRDYRFLSYGFIEPYWLFIHFVDEISIGCQVKSRQIQICQHWCTLYTHVSPYCLRHATKNAILRDRTYTLDSPTIVKWSLL